MQRWAHPKRSYSGVKLRGRSYAHSPQLSQQADQTRSRVYQQPQRAAGRCPFDGFLQRGERGSLVPLSGKHKRVSFLKVCERA